MKRNYNYLNITGKNACAIIGGGIAATVGKLKQHPTFGKFAQSSKNPLGNFTMKRTNSLRNKRSTAFVFTQEGAAVMEKENLKRRVEFRMNYEIVHYPNQLPPMPQKEAKS